MKVVQEHTLNPTTAQAATTSVDNDGGMNVSVAVSESTSATTTMTAAGATKVGVVNKVASGSNAGGQSRRPLQELPINRR
jgi:hypothetical protein